MNGILLVDKPADWTSMDVCAKLRGVFHEKRIGHSGTLDPMATGLLVVFLGRATRAVEFAESHSKEYIAGLRLGVSTDTQDISGNTLSECAADVSREQLETCLRSFTGPISQIPPMYSAIKVGGKKLYEIARKGGSVERKAREITIHSLELLSFDGTEALLRVRCSKGTYIRTLCNDIGQALGCGGCMSSLRRTAAGDFCIDSAMSLQSIIEKSDSGELQSLLLPVDSIFADHPKITLNQRREQELKNGVRFPCKMEEGVYRAYSESGEFVALVKSEEGKMIIIKSFFEVN